MASIVIAGDVGPEVKEMVENLINGKISFNRFFKFLSDNGLESKFTYKKESVRPSTFNEFAGDILSTIFNIPDKDTSSDDENFDDSEDNKEVEDDEYENPDELWNKTKETYEKHVRDTIEYAKRLIDDYGDFEEDDIEHAKAVKLFHSLMVLGRTYRQRANKGDNQYNIPNFTPENILKFIDFLNLPTDKIEASLEKGKSYYYKMKIYKDFDDFKTSMKNAYGIENVWNPEKETPEWFESIRNKLYREFYPTEDIVIDESEWNEFMKWKENKSKLSTTKKNVSSASAKEVDVEKSFEDQCRSIVDKIINEFSPILTGKALAHFECVYKSNDNRFMKQLKRLYNTVKSAKNDGFICFIDVENKDIKCNIIPNTKIDIEKTILDKLYKAIIQKDSSDKKSSTSKKTSSSTSAKDDKPAEKKTSKKSTTKAKTEN